MRHSQLACANCCTHGDKYNDVAEQNGVCVGISWAHLRPSVLSRCTQTATIVDTSMVNSLSNGSTLMNREVSDRIIQGAYFQKCICNQLILIKAYITVRHTYSSDCMQDCVSETRFITSNKTILINLAVAEPYVSRQSNQSGAGNESIA